MLISPITPNSNNNYQKAPAFAGHTIAEKFEKKGLLYLAHQTAFFREPVTLEQVKRYIACNFGNKKEINILVGGCSTGEEAFSLSMLFRNLKNKINIIGFDLSPKAIKTAKSGKVLMQTSVHEFERDSFLRDAYLVFDDPKNLTSQQKKYKKMFDDTFEPLGGTFYKLFHDLKRLFTDKNSNVGRRSRYFKLKEGKITNCHFIEGDIRELDKLDAPKQVDVLFFRNATYHLVVHLPRRRDKAIVLTDMFRGIWEKLAPNGIFVNGEMDGIQIEDVLLIPKILRFVGFKPVNPNFDGSASIWKKVGKTEV